MAFGYGCENFAKYEQQGIGIQWYNINKSPEEGERYTFVVSIIMMLVDAVLHFLLTWYIENVFPGTQEFLHFYDVLTMPNNVVLFDSAQFRSLANMAVLAVVIHTN